MAELQPDALGKAVFDAILPFYGADLDTPVLAAEAKWREKAGEALQAHPGYKGASRRIKATWDSASTAASILHNEQSRAATILRDSIPSQPELPTAEPKGTAATPLFDSGANFITTTRRLIRHKKLIGSDDNIC
jgi:hypothetical protein